MSMDPEVDPQIGLPVAPRDLEATFQVAGALAPVVGEPRTRAIPNIGHTLVFLALFGGALLLVQSLALGLALGLHWFPHKTYLQLMKEPRLLVPASFTSYLLGGLAAIAIFTHWWRRPFAEGVHWNLERVKSARWVFIGAGILLSVVVQLLSNFLPIPKELPIDDFFRSPVDVWIVAIFGIFIAPVFEELAFRGFLLPALATSWDWVTGRISPRIREERAAAEAAASPLIQAPAGFARLLPLNDPAWSPAALAFASTLTSVAFALLHADQLAHAYAPLAVLFCVSLVLCVVRLRFHSLAASATVHACYNGTIFALLFFATSGFRHLDKLNK